MSQKSASFTKWWDRLRIGGQSDAAARMENASPNEIPPVTILNSDDEITSAESLSWLLKCIFREPDLCRHVIGQIGEEVASRKTFGEASRFLWDYYRRRVGNQTLRPSHSLETRAFQALVTHQEQTALNESAYQRDRQDDPESGYWPNPSYERNRRSLFQELPVRRRWKFISKKTCLVSAGSCFALQIAHELQRDGYNYLVTERNSNGFLTEDTSRLSDASAAWGIIFNTPAFRQLVERAFGLRKLPRILWFNGEHYLDPFREEMRFANVEEYSARFEAHTQAARAAFIQAEVLIITLGLNEIWSFKMDGSVFSRSPWRIAPSFVEHRTLSVEENVQELELMLRILRHYNPNIRLIVTLSPIPLHATFLHERYHVVEANMHSKAVLRVAAQDFVEKNQGVYYFPSFELVTYGFENPWTNDHRHVNRAVVARVMEMFREVFVV